MATKTTRISESVWRRATAFRSTLATRNRTKIDDLDLVDYLVTTALDAEGVGTPDEFEEEEERASGSGG